MKYLAPLAMWLLVTLFLATATVLFFVLQMHAFAIITGVIAVLAGLMTQDEFVIYMHNRKRSPKHEPPTRIPGYPEQPKRDIR